MVEQQLLDQVKWFLEDVENRKNPRVPQALRVLSPQIPYLQGMTENMSANGLSILARGPVKKGTRLAITLDVGGSMLFPIKLRGECRWCEPTSTGHYQVGLCLDESKSHRLQAISSYVSRQITLMRRERLNEEAATTS